MEANRIGSMYGEQKKKINKKKKTSSQKELRTGKLIDLKYLITNNDSSSGLDKRPPVTRENAQAEEKKNRFDD